MFRQSVFVFLFCNVLFWPGWSFAQGGGSQSVRVVEARKQAFVDRTEALGTLKAKESVALTVNVTENISAIHFEDGEDVKEGDILVEMVSAEEDALLVEADTNVHEARRQLDRIKQLVKAGTASESVYDQRLRDYESARARLTAVQSRLKDRVVRAPFNGVVGLRNVSLGALVQPGDVITTLTDNSKMKLDFAVPSLFLPVIKKGLPVTGAARVYPKLQFKGVISSVDNQIDVATRSVTVRALLPNSDGLLKQGMLMNVEVMMNERNEISIPEESLMPVGKENFVMIAVKNSESYIAEKRKVVIASRREGEVEISEGISEGDLVITHGAFKIKPGSQVIFDAVTSVPSVSANK